MEQDTAAVQGRACQPPACAQYVDLNPLFGRVGYTYAGGVDQPLSLVRINYVDKPWGDSTIVWTPFSVVPHWNWRGHAEFGTFGDGGVGRCVTPTSTRCVEIQWRVKAFAYTQSQDGFLNPSTLRTWGWFGTLRDLKEDGTGTQYRRHRYVDPATGRFTQEDPIGLAGGTNPYSYANGDPVNFSDPFGLWCERRGADAPGGFVLRPVPEAYDGGFWRLLSQDSVLLYWAEAHSVTRLRLRYLGDSLEGIAERPRQKPTNVVAYRTDCPGSSRSE